MKRKTTTIKRWPAKPTPIRSSIERALRLVRWPSIADLDRITITRAALTEMIAVGDLRNEARAIAGDDYRDIELAAARKFAALSQWNLTSYAACLRLTIDDYCQIGRAA